MKDNKTDSAIPFNRRNFIKKGVAASVALTAGLSTSSLAENKEKKKIKALLVTGGGYHDYNNQKTILTEGTSKLIDIDWTIWHLVKADEMKEALSKKDWAAPYDVIVYNFCHAHETDEEYINSVVQVHKEGKPCVAIHCTTHSYHWKVGGGKKSKTDKEWNKLLGIVSLNHGPQGPAITVHKSETKHEAYKLSTEEWATPKGELYNISKVYPSATVLARGTNGKAEQPVIWVNKYEKAHVFGTTIGHHNETMKTEKFLKTIADGITWVVEESKKA